MAKKKPQRRRSSYVKLPALPLANAPVSVRGYDPDGNLVCTMQISSAGIRVRAKKKQYPLQDVTWEQLVKILGAE